MQISKSIIEAWQGRKGENVEIGVETLITSRLIETIDSEVVTSIEKLVASALVNKLIQDSLIPQAFEWVKKNDETMGVWEITGKVDAKIEPHILPLTMKMDTLLQQALALLQMKRISKKRKEDWLDDLRAVTGKSYDKS